LIKYILRNLLKPPKHKSCQLIWQIVFTVLFFQLVLSMSVVPYMIRLGFVH
jgi:hypothetical protein